MPASAQALKVFSSAAISDSFRQCNLPAFQKENRFAACLLRLLVALNWHSDPRHIIEALPHVVQDPDLVDIRNTLARLGVKTSPEKMGLTDIDPRLTPCLFLTSTGYPLVVTGVGESGHMVFDGTTGTEVVVQKASKVSGTAYFIGRTKTETGRPSQDAASATAPEGAESWGRAMARRFQPVVGRLLLITLASNIIGFTIPLVVMLVYDRVIGLHSTTMLAALAIAVVILLAGDMGLKYARARIIGYVGGRFDNLVGSGVLERILHLPARYTELSPVSQQVARIKQLESVRDFFSGPLAIVMLELLFLPFYLVIIAVLAGGLVLVPLSLIPLYVVAGMVLQPALKRAITQTGNVQGRRQSFLLEMLGNLREIKQLGAQGLWRNRFREISGEAAHTTFEAAMVSHILQTVSHMLMFMAGAGTLALGALMVMKGQMTQGALIATMALIWRMLSPLQVGFLALTKLGQIKSSITKINNLMLLKTEQRDRTGSIVSHHFAGAIGVARVSFKYQPTAEPALLGVQFDLKPGEILAITGGNGSGKSTLLKLVLGLHQPQAGAIFVDGIDIRQIDPWELRTAIGYMPQTATMFHGTIAQNMRLSMPLATEDEIAEACRAANILDDIMALPDGLQTWIGDHKSRRFSEGFMQRLNLARAYLRNPAILLLDEPGNGLDPESDRLLIQTLQKFKGQRSVMMVTHRPSHMRIADRLLVMEEGRIVMMGPPNDVLKRMEELNK